MIHNKIIFTFEDSEIEQIAKHIIKHAAFDWAVNDKEAYVFADCTNWGNALAFDTFRVWINVDAKADIVSCEKDSYGDIVSATIDNNSLRNVSIHELSVESYNDDIEYESAESENEIEERINAALNNITKNNKVA